MCTVVINYAPSAPWPLILGANRDEMAGRPWQPPARHWDDFPYVVAGRDEEAGGTWMGINDDGVVAAILNRPGSLGPAAGKRSRGELPLEALSHADAREAAEALANIDGRAYRSFNLVIADANGAFWLRSTGDRSAVDAEIVEPGVSLITAHDLNDVSSPRISEYLPRFRAAVAPDPDKETWGQWPALLASRESRHGDTERGGMTVGDGHGFSTVSSSLIALPGPQRFGEKPIWNFAAGAPDTHDYQPVALDR